MESFAALHCSAARLVRRGWPRLPLRQINGEVKQDGPTVSE